MIIFSSRLVSGCVLEMPTPPVFFFLQGRSKCFNGVN